LILSNMAWVRDRKHRPVLQLSVDGHQAHIRSEQKRELTRRGIVKGVDFLASEWRDQADHAFIQRDVEPGLAEVELAGCTDDPRVFALYEEMCRAIAADTWQPGPRSPASDWDRTEGASISTVTNDLAAQSQTETVLDRPLANEARTGEELEAAGVADDRDQTARLRQRHAGLAQQVFGAKVLAKERHIAELEAELAEPRDDYEQANWDCVRSTADHADAKGRLEQSRNRLRTASSRLSGLQRDIREHGRKLSELQAEAQGADSQQAPAAGSAES
jgi:hypothetical protein